MQYIRELPDGNRVQIAKWVWESHRLEKGYRSIHQVEGLLIYEVRP